MENQIIKFRRVSGPLEETTCSDETVGGITESAAAARAWSLGGRSTPHPSCRRAWAPIPYPSVIAHVATFQPVDPGPASYAAVFIKGGKPVYLDGYLTSCANLDLRHIALATALIPNNPFFSGPLVVHAAPCPLIEKLHDGRAVSERELKSQLRLREETDNVFEDYSEIEDLLACMEARNAPVLIRNEDPVWGPHIMDYAVRIFQAKRCSAPSLWNQGKKRKAKNRNRRKRLFGPFKPVPEAAICEPSKAVPTLDSEE